MKFINKFYIIALLTALNISAQEDNQEIVIITDSSDLLVNISNPDHEDIMVTVKIEKIDFELPRTLAQLAELINLKKIKTKEDLLIALEHFKELKEELKNVIAKKLKTDAQLIQHVMIKSKRNVRDMILTLFKLIKDREYLRELMDQEE